MQVDHYWCMALYGSGGRWCVPVMTEVSGIFWHLHLIIWWLRPHSSEWLGSLVIHTCITALQDTRLSHPDTIISLICNKYSVHKEFNGKESISFSFQFNFFYSTGVRESICRFELTGLNSTRIQLCDADFNKTLISLSVQSPAPCSSPAVILRSNYPISEQVKIRGNGSMTGQETLVQESRRSSTRRSKARNTERK